MSTKIQVRRGTAAQWTSANPTLAEGEIGFETDTDTGKFKIGTGALWNSTVYANTTVSNIALLSASNIFTAGQTISSTGNASLVLDAGTGGAGGSQVSYVDFKVDGTIKANIAINEGIAGTPLQINSSGLASNIILAEGGGNVGIGITPTVKLDVNGAVKATSFTGSLTGNGNSYSTTQTLTVANDLVFLTAATAWTLTLPTPTAGKMLHITRTDSTAVIITVSGHINGTAATNNVAWFPVSTANRRVILISNGTTWYPMVAGTVV